MDTLSPGSRLGRYEIRSKIGEGGMGEVYLAEDLQLHRKVALKVLPPNVAANGDLMRRFKQEAQAAAALNHPSIAHIYEIGESDGTNFIAMEFVDGHTLREQALTASSKVSDVLEIAIQIANAISAAHAAGIVHRDIKPENVMIRGDGIVKVLDFGLAKLARPKDWRSEDATLPLLRTDTGVVMGTVFYMSPEQARGLPVDARTDIWSLGVVIFETISGRLPFDGATHSDILVSILEREPPPLTLSPPTFTNELQRIVTKSLRKNREERYQEINDLLVDLKKLRQEVEISGKLLRTPNQQIYSADRSTEIAAITSPASAGASSSTKAAPRIISAKLIAAIAMAALVIAIIGIYFVFFNHRSALTEKDTIMLADFVNQTGDPTFDGSTLKQALAVQLRQTPFVKLFPEESVRETLRYMGRSEDEPLTKPTAREICRRQGLKALIVGSIASLGRDYVITLEAVNGQTGETIASQQIEATGKEQVLKSLGQAALDLRQQLGESLAYLQKYNAPIEQATTSSLEALNIYSKGLEQIYSGNYKSALPLFNRAVELDPNFAEAYVWLSWTYANFGDFAKTSEFAEKAYSLRSRVTELEKLRIDDIYHLWATGDFDKQKAADDLIKQLYPNDWVPRNSLIIGYSRLGQLEQALAEGREGIRVNPNEVHLYWHVSTVLSRLNRFDEAADVIKEGQERKLDFYGYRHILYTIAFARDDSAEMQKQMDLIRKTDGEAAAFAMQARMAIFYGRWREARALYLRAIASPGQFSSQGTNATPPVTATIAQALFGFCQPAGDDVKQSLALSRIVSSSTIMFVPVLANGSLCGDANEAQKLADEEARRYPRAIQQSVFSVPVIRAAIALQRNQPDQAIQFLNLALPYDGGNGGYWPDYLRGQAYLRLQKGNEAAVEFQKILDHRGWDPMSPVYPLAHLGLGRAALLTNDAPAARKHYEDFFALWKDADQDLPILMEAKKEYEKLK